MNEIKWQIIGLTILCLYLIHIDGNNLENIQNTTLEYFFSENVNVTDKTDNGVGSVNSSIDPLELGKISGGNDSNKFQANYNHSNVNNSRIAQPSGSLNIKYPSNIIQNKKILTSSSNITTREYGVPNKNSFKREYNTDIMKKRHKAMKKNLAPLAHGMLSHLIDGQFLSV